MTKKLIFLDTETTGLTNEDRIVEIAAIQVEYKKNKVKVIDTFHHYLNPEIPIPAQSTEVHGISNKQVEKAKKFSQIVRKFLKFIKGAKVVAHNMSFDQRMLNNELKRLNLPPLVCHVKKIEDTLHFARVLSNSDNNKLDTLCDYYGVDRSSRAKFHGALIDCELLANVYPSLKKQYKQKSVPLNRCLGFNPDQTDFAKETIDELLEKAINADSAISLLKKVSVEIKDIIKDKIEGKEYQGPIASVEFTSKINTDWQAVQRTYLPDTDLSSFKKPTSAMKIVPIN